MKYSAGLGAGFCCPPPGTTAAVGSAAAPAPAPSGWMVVTCLCVFFGGGTVWILVSEQKTMYMTTTDIWMDAFDACAPVLRNPSPLSPPPLCVGVWVGV